MTRTPETDTFYRDFRVGHPEAPLTYEVAAFGDSTAMQDKLVDLVLAGTKRATASLARDYQAVPATFPKPGDHVVAVDGRGRPRLVWMTVEVVVKPMREVDDAFAFDEGEGDRTRADWLAGHSRTFGRQAEREGFVLDDGIPVVFERFRVVWPAEE